MKNLILFLSIIFLSCGVTESEPEPEGKIMEVIYFEMENSTYIKFSNILYNQEKFAIIYDEDFIDRFTVVHDVSENAVKFIGKFDHSIKIGMNIYFSESGDF